MVSLAEFPEHDGILSHELLCGVLINIQETEASVLGIPSDLLDALAPFHNSSSQFVYKRRFEVYNAVQTFEKDQ